MPVRMITPSSIAAYFREDEQRVLETRWEVAGDSLYIIFYTLVTGRETARIRVIETMFIPEPTINRILEIQPQASVQGIQKLIGYFSKDIVAFLNYVME